MDGWTDRQTGEWREEGGECLAMASKSDHQTRTSAPSPAPRASRGLAARRTVGSQRPGLLLLPPAHPRTRAPSCASDPAAAGGAGESLLTSRPRRVRRRPRALPAAPRSPRRTN